MKLKSIGVCTLVALLAVSCGRKSEDADVAVDENGIPVSVSEILMGDSCRIDTIYAGGDNVYMMVNNPDYMQRILFDRHGVIANNPTLTVDSLSETSFRIGDILNSIVVIFTIEDNIEALRDMFPVYPDYTTVTYAKSQAEPEPTIFSLCVSSPDDKVANAAEIRQWVASEIDSVSFNGSFEALGEHLAKDMNECVAGTGSVFTMYDNHSAMIYFKTEAFVTYLNMFSTFLGGAHGMYGYSFPTYLTQENRALTVDYVFEPGTANDIRELLYESLLSDVDFTSNNNINSKSQLKSYIGSQLYGEILPIPDPGLLAKGMVFCYQPYEIGSFADGAFQLVIPYSKLKPYMTDAGKKLIP